MKTVADPFPLSPDSNILPGTVIGGQVNKGNYTGGLFIPSIVITT